MIFLSWKGVPENIRFWCDPKSWIQLLRCTSFCNSTFFIFFNLHLYLISYILMALSITITANWKLFAFFGKYVQNRPSKNVLSTTPWVNCVQWDCVFIFAQSCRMLLFALGVAGSWSGLGRSVILEYSAFLLSEFPLHHSTIFTEDVCFVLWISLPFFVNRKERI